MSGLGTVCAHCRGRGYVYGGKGLSRPCPVCHGARPCSSAEQLHALEKLRICWARYLAGETADFNLALAVRGALDTGLSMDALHRRAGVARANLRRAAGGQGSLL